MNTQKKKGEDSMKFLAGIKKGATKTEAFLRKNRGAMLQMSLIAALIVVPHAMGWVSCEAAASKSYPWSGGVNGLAEEFTSNLPALGCVISIATSALLWQFGGNSDITQKAMKGAFGTSICLSAPAMAEMLSGKDVSGCLF